MRKILFLVQLLVILLFTTACSSYEIIKYEQLLDVKEKSTVYVEAKAILFSPSLSDEELTADTQWEWLIKGWNGDYHQSYLFVNMADYEAMDPSKRDLILNHQDCLLELRVKGSINWEVSSFRAFVPQPSIGFFWQMLIVISIAIIGVLIMIMYFNAAARDKQPRQRERGKLLLTFFLLSELSRNDKKKK